MERIAMSKNKYMAQCAEHFSNMSVKHLASYVCENFGPASQGQVMQELLDLQRNVTPDPDREHVYFEAARAVAAERCPNSDDYQVDDTLYEHQFSDSDTGCWVSMWHWVDNNAIREVMPEEEPKPF